MEDQVLDSGGPAGEAGRELTPVERARAEVGGFCSAMAGMEARQLAALARVSPAVHFAACLRIFDKRNVQVRPVPNILQLRMSKVVEFYRALGVPLWMIVCKPRQVGCSTFSGHIGRHKALRDRVTGLTISDKRDNSDKLVARLDEYAAGDGYPWGVGQKSAAGVVRWTNGSYLDTDTAENPKAGIGVARQFLHASEVGKWPKTTVKNDKRTMAALLPSVSKVGPSLVIAESTPEGLGGWFGETYQTALTIEEVADSIEAGKGIPAGWVKVFAGWWEFEEYRMEVGKAEAEEIMRGLSLFEREEVERWGLDAGQVKWWRHTLLTECGGDMDRFIEYYPPDDVRCFMVSGRPRFSQERLSNMLAMVKGRGSPDLVALTDMGGLEVGVARVATVGEAHAIIWEWPREGMSYIEGLDPATGADQTASKNPDAHSCGVWRRAYVDEDGKTWPHKLVARLVPPCRWDVDITAGKAALLSRMYGGCMVVPEVNMGLGFLELFKLMGVPLYEREVIDPMSPGRDKVKRQIGWKLSDQNQRNQIIEVLAALVREGAVDIPCPHMLGEMGTFVIDDAGKAQARSGCHDDDVMMAAMSLHCIGNATMYLGKVRKRRKPRDYYKWLPPGMR